MTFSVCDPRLIRAANALVQEQFDVQPGEGVLVTTDLRTEPALVEALLAAAIRCGARPMVATIPPLPFQGALADPYVPDALAAAAASADVWFDLTFPYLAGSRMHDLAMKAMRARYALLATAAADSFARLYGAVDFSALMDYQMALVDYLDGKAGSTARFTCPLGTDVSFTLDKIKLRRERVARTPGMHTVPGAQSLYPVLSTVRGTVVLGALFDEHYRLLRRPVTLRVDGRLAGFDGAASEDRPVLERALRRAAGGADFGWLIHFTMGFHPSARITGEHFIEDIRAFGTNAIGMGLPWWEPGGGENHPDGVVLDQSLWLDGELIVEAGRIVGPAALAEQYARVQPVYG
jgi:leucyl aminopeptidase (aminopeptidase T)